MHDSGPNFPFERDDSYGFLLRREPSSESLKLIFQASEEERALNDRYSRRAIQFSKKLLLSQSKSVKKQRKETKKIFSERDYWMRHQRRMERNQRALSSSVSSDPKRSAHPVKSFYRRKRELIGQQILSIQDGLRGSHGDLPSPKSDSWFGEEGTDLFGVEDSSIPRTNLNRGYSSRRQNPFSLVERGVDMIGDKINQLKRNSISAASSPASPSVSTFMVPFARHFDHKPISNMDRNASSTELSSPGLSSSDSDSSATHTSVTSPSVSQASPTLQTMINTSLGDFKELNSVGLLHKGKSVHVPEVIPESEEETNSFKLQSSYDPRFPSYNNSSGSEELDLTSDEEPQSRLAPPSSLFSQPASAVSVSSSNQNPASPGRRSHSRSSSRLGGSSSIRRINSLLHSSPLITSLNHHHNQSLKSSLCGNASFSAFSSPRFYDASQLLNVPQHSSEHTVVVVDCETNLDGQNFSDSSLSLPWKAQKLTDDTTPRTSPRKTSSSSKRRSCDGKARMPQSPKALLPMYATDVLIQQQGGFSFFGREKFNERFRSQPWQTIKTVRLYDRPGEWDARYLDGVSVTKVVPTPHDTERFLLPATGWSWVNEFTIDKKSRPVDSQGWEYYDIFARKWKPCRNGLKTFIRRRRWVRTRVKRATSIRRSFLVDTSSCLEIKGSLKSSDELEENKFVIIEISKIGPKQVIKFYNLASRVTDPSAPPSVIPPFRLYTDNKNLDFQNPFFSRNEIVCKLLDRIRNFDNRCDSPDLATDKGLDQVENDIKEACLKHLTQINMKRAIKALRDLSEHNKIRLWRYWFGLDTYEDGNHWQGRPDLQDVWDMINNHLDEILDAFIFQRTKFMFLYLISRMYPESFGTPAPRRRKIQSQHLPDCFSPIMEPKYSSQTNTPILKQESPHTSTPSTPSSGINLSRNLQTKLGYWNDTIRLLVDFNWKVDEDIDVIAQVGNQIRLDLRRTVKNHLRRQQQSNTKSIKSS